MKTHEIVLIAVVSFVVGLVIVALMTRGKLPAIVTNTQPKAAA